MAKEGVDLNESNNTNECKSKDLVIRHNDKLIVNIKHIKIISGRLDRWSLRRKLISNFFLLQELKPELIKETRRLTHRFKSELKNLLKKNESNDLNDSDDNHKKLVCAFK